MKTYIHTETCTSMSIAQHGSKWSKSEQPQRPLTDEHNMVSLDPRARHLAANRSEAPTCAVPRTDPEHTTLREGTRHRRPRSESTCVTRPGQARPQTGRGLVGAGGWVVMADGDGASFGVMECSRIR